MVANDFKDYYVRKIVIDALEGTFVVMTNLNADLLAFNFDWR